MLTLTYQSNNRAILRLTSRGWRDKQDRATLPPYLPPLDMGSEFQDSGLRVNPTERIKPGWGLPANPTRFGLAAKDRIRRAGGAIDRLGLTKQSVFLTGTLPGSTSEAIAALAAWSGYLINNLRQWLRDLADKLGAEFYFFSVWEWQKRGALHLHACLATGSESLLERVEKGWKSYWIRQLVKVSAKSGVDLFQRGSGGSWIGKKSQTQTDCQRVSRSVSSYIAKYTSKDKSPTPSEQTPPYPSRWWSQSRNLKSVISTFERKFTSLRSYRQDYDILKQIRSKLKAFAFSETERGSRFDPRSKTIYLQFDRELAPPEIATKLIETLGEEYFTRSSCLLEAKMYTPRSVYVFRTEYNNLCYQKPREIQACREIYAKQLNINVRDVTTRGENLEPSQYRQFQAFVLVYSSGYLAINELWDDCFSLARAGGLYTRVLEILSQEIARERQTPGAASPSNPEHC